MAELTGSNRAVVRFHAPVPLGRPVSTIPTAISNAGPAGDAAPAFDVVDGVDKIASVSVPAAVEVGPFERLEPMAVAVAESAWLDPYDGEHPFPSCYGCGTDRANDGLGLQSGRVPGSDDFAAFWTPRGAGVVPTWMIWAALDCPTGIPTLPEVGQDEVPVTGQLAVEIRGPVHAEQGYQIVSRVVGRNGRKFSTEAALIDRRGAILAVASAIWLAVPRAALFSDSSLSDVEKPGAKVLALAS